MTFDQKRHEIQICFLETACKVVPVQIAVKQQILIYRISDSKSENSV